MVIEIYKAVSNLPGGANSFVRINHSCNLCSKSELIVQSIKTVFEDKDSISCFGSVIWNSIPAELREINSWQVLIIYLSL